MDRRRIGFVKASAWMALALVIALAVMAGEAKRQTGTGLMAESAQDTPRPVESVSEGGNRITQGCEIIQTMGFSRCGHSVTRRVSAAAGVIGADFGETQAYYSLWQVESFSPERVTMNREIPLFCPMHQVLSVNEAGEIVLTHNVYGDGMAVEKTYDASIGDFDEEIQDQLLLGLGFEDAAAAERWLNTH